jgi:hypothetical protein
VELFAAFPSTRYWLPSPSVHPVQAREEDGLYSAKEGRTLVIPTYACLPLLFSLSCAFLPSFFCTFNHLECEDVITKIPYLTHTILQVIYLHKTKETIFKSTWCQKHNLWMTIESAVMSCKFAVMQQKVWKIESISLSTIKWI